MDLLDLLDDITAERLPCGHKKGRGIASGWDIAASDEWDHAERCLRLTCPLCHLTEPTAYLLVMEHGIRYDGQCSLQGWMFDRAAHCVTCRWPTFGQWPCRNQACPMHECGEPCERTKGNPNYLDTHPWGKDAELGCEGLRLRGRTGS